MRAASVGNTCIIATSGAVLTKYRREELAVGNVFVAPNLHCSYLVACYWKFALRERQFYKITRTYITRTKRIAIDD